MAAAAPAAAAPDTPAVAALKAKFTLDYMTKSHLRPHLFSQYLETLGTDGILDVLEERNPYCHSEAHALGRAVFAKYQDLGKSLLECGARCTSACLHGVVQEAFGRSTIEELRPRLATLCTEGAMAEIRRPGPCAHGMGHALMLLFEGDVEKSIAGCGGFSTPVMEYYCATGVYMEHFDQAATRSEPETPRSPLYPCDTYATFPAACYRYQGRRLLEKLGGDREKMAALCRTLPAVQRRACFHGVGSAAAETIGGEPELMPTICPEAPAEDRTMCLEGMIEIRGQFEPVESELLCARLTGEAAAECLAAARGGMYRLDKPSLPLYLVRN